MIAAGAQDPEAVQARHADVEQHEAGRRLGPRRLERLFAVGRLAHLVAGPPRVTRDQRADVFPVIGHQDDLRLASLP